MQRDIRIFLSHASANEEVMYRIADSLKENGLNCWYAQRDVRPGEHYNERIIEGIKESDIVMVLITEDVEPSKYVPKEVDRAISYDKVLVPVRLDHAELSESLELHLCNEQWVDLTKFEDFDDALGFLYERLEEVFNQIEAEKNNRSEKLEHQKPIVIDHKRGIFLYEKNQDFIEDLAETFVEPPSFQHWKAKLKGTNILNLYSSNHTGKDTTAVLLMNQLHVEKVYEWSKTTTVREMIHHPLRKNTGFILKVESADDFYYIRVDEWNEFESRLKEKNCFVVLISTEEPKEGVAQLYSEKHQPVEEVTSLIAPHVKNLDLDNEEKVLNWLETEEAKKLLPEYIPPFEASVVAYKCKAYVEGQLSKEGFLFSSTENVRKRIKDWDRGEPSDEEVALYLTIGLLEGEAFTTIRNHSKDLLKLFAKEELESSTMGRLSKDELLSKFHARAISENRDSDSGTFFKERVMFEEPADGLYIWEYMWTQYPEYQQPITDWIFSLVKQGVVEHDRIARIVGHLAKVDYMTIRKEMLHKWAQSNATRDRFLVVHILEELASDEDWQKNAFMLAKSWARQEHHSNWAWTGIVFLGKDIGHIYYPETLNVLKQAYQSRNKNVRFAVKQSLEQLGKIAIEDEAYQNVFLSFWAGWLEEEAESDQFNYVLRLSQSIYQRYYSLFLKSEEKWMSVYWVPFVRDCLADKSMRKMTMHVIHVWIIKGSSDENLQRKVQQLIKEVYNSSKPRVQDFLFKQLKRRSNEHPSTYEYLFKRSVQS